jgi:hypothetical protein
MSYCAVRSLLCYKLSDNAWHEYYKIIFSNQQSMTKNMSHRKESRNETSKHRKVRV